MSVGKTNPKHYRLYADEFDLSGDARGFGQAGIVYEEEEVAGWSDGVRNFTLGWPAAMVEGFQAAFNNAAAGSLTALQNQEEYVVSLLLGIRAAPAAGDLAFSCPLECRGLLVEGAMVNADFIGPGQGFTVPSKVWGNVLYPKTTISVDTTTASINLLAASSRGAIAYLHVLTAETVGSWVLKVQDSPNDAAWADYITFTANGTTLTAEQKVDTTSMDQYVRLDANYTGGGSTNLTLLVTIIPQ